MPRFGWSRVATGLLVWVMTGMVVSGSAQNTPPSTVDAAAREAFEAGRKAYERGRFAEALDDFGRAYALSPNPLLLFNIGCAADADLQNQRAVEGYQAYLREVPEAENREYVEARLEKLRQLMSGGVHGTARPKPRLEAQYSASAPPPQSPAASADPGPSLDSREIGRVRLHAGLGVGAGGNWHTAYDDESEHEHKDALDATAMVQLGAAYVWPYFGVGGELRVNMVKWDSSVFEPEREQVLDLMVKPRVGSRLSTTPFELYGALPLGLSIPFFGELPVQWDDTSSFSADFNLGVTAGVVLGATYFLNPRVGFNVETGWTMHSYRFTDETGDTGRARFHQVNALSANLVVAL